MQIKFEKSVFAVKHLTPSPLPELILCGRSNVGKSSFINSLFNRKGLAKTSSTPGKTQSLNFYLVEEKFYIVDLPGFGYAKAREKDRIAWQKLVEGYITSRENIYMAFHFVDSRHNPTQLDIVLNEYLMQVGIPTTIILSKTDKLKQSEIAKVKTTIREFFPEAVYGENLLMYSALKGTGRKEILSKLTNTFLR